MKRRNFLTRLLALPLISVLKPNQYFQIPTDDQVPKLKFRTIDMGVLGPITYGYWDPAPKFKATSSFYVFNVGNICYF